MDGRRVDAVREIIRTACRCFPCAMEVKREFPFAPDEVAINIEPMVIHRVTVEKQVFEIGGSRCDLKVFYRREFNLLHSLLRRCQHCGRVLLLDEEKRATLFVIEKGGLLENELSLLRQHLPVARKRTL